ncbi:MAG: Ku protein [Hyphomicrobiales bacterium]
MPRPSRPYWRGQLRLSLVSLAVELYNAVESSSQISFRMIHKPTGKRVQYRKAVPDVGEVSSEEIVKGYEIARDQYVLLEPDEVDAVRLESKHVLDLVQFVDMAEIDPRYFERPYYLLPADDNAAEGYVVIREALERSRKAGIGQLVVGGREHLVAVAPVGRGLVTEILRYGAEVKPADAFFDEIPEGKIDPEMVEIASQIVERKSATFDPHAFRDRYATALRDLVEEKARGRSIEAPASPAPTAQVVDLMGALKRSLEKTPSGARGRSRSSAPRKRKAG